MKPPLTSSPHSHGYVQIFDSAGEWICTCKEELVEIIKAAIVANDKGVHMNVIKYAHPNKGTALVKVCQPSYARMNKTRTNRIGVEVPVPLPYPTVAQADRTMYAKGYVRTGTRRD